MKRMTEETRGLLEEETSQRSSMERQTMCLLDPWAAAVYRRL
jgi:hypothetical protein